MGEWFAPGRRRRRQRRCRVASIDGRAAAPPTRHARLRKGLVGFWKGYFNYKRCRCRHFATITPSVYMGERDSFTIIFFWSGPVSPAIRRRRLCLPILYDDRFWEHEIYWLLNTSGDLIKRTACGNLLSCLAESNKCARYDIWTKWRRREHAGGVLGRSFYNLWYLFPHWISENTMPI